MRKKYLALVSLCAGTMLLSACGNLGSGSGNSVTQATQRSNKGYQTTGQADTSDYQGVIENGRYLTSKARGVGIIQNSENMYNYRQALKSAKGKILLFIFLSPNSFCESKGIGLEPET